MLDICLRLLVQHYGVKEISAECIPIANDVEVISSSMQNAAEKTLWTLYGRRIVLCALQAEDAWLCSGSLRLLSGDVSSNLAHLLGWREPLSVSTLGTQLIELGRMHPEVTTAF